MKKKIMFFIAAGGVCVLAEVLTRTAIGDNGWSQLDYNGQTVYAVSSYLTLVQ